MQKEKEKKKTTELEIEKETNTERPTELACDIFFLFFFLLGGNIFRVQPVKKYRMKYTIMSELKKRFKTKSIVFSRICVTILVPLNLTL